MENYKIYDVVLLKKEHPCTKRTNQFKIIGLDGEVRLKCMSCGGIVLLKRSAFEKACKKILAPESTNQ